MKPELIIFSQNLLGGGASFHRNMINNKPDDFFDIKTIYLNPSEGNFTKSLESDGKKGDILFTYGNESQYQIAKRLQRYISDTEGAIVANLPEELFTLSLFPRPNKTIYFICHDDGFIDLAKKYHHLIDIFIAHNFTVYETLQKILSPRIKDIHFIPHGVSITDIRRNENYNNPLQIVFLARHHILKGIYDIPLINQQLIENNIKVEWIILGDGQERENFIVQTKHLDNFKFSIPENTKKLLDILSKTDIYILPSRKDGLPVSLLESMSVGCVPIVSNFSEGIKKVVTDNIGYVLDIGNIDLFTQTIIHLHNNRPELEYKSNNAVKTIEKNYDIRVRAKEYFDLYAQYKSLKINNYDKKQLLILKIKRLYYFLGVNKLKAILMPVIKRQS